MKEEEEEIKCGYFDVEILEANGSVVYWKKEENLSMVFRC
jgi:hypothetical protein